MATATIYATGQDGSVRNAATGSSSGAWTTLRNASSGSSVAYTADDNTTFVEAVNGGWGDSKQYIDRGFLAFTDAVIPTGAIITAATINLYVTTLNTGSGGSVTVVSGSQSGTSSLATSDFSACGSTEFVASRTNFSSLTTSAYNTFTLNSSGISNITVGGTSKFCFRSSFDLDNSNPTGSTLSYFTIATTEHTGTSQDPYLSVTYYLEKTYTADAIIANPAPTKTYTADAIIEGLGNGSKTYTADAVISRVSITADSFLETGGSNVSLSSHTPSGPAATGTWASHPASGFPCTVKPSSNRYIFSGGVGTSIDYIDTTPPTADYDVEATVTIITEEKAAGVGGRWDPSATTGYTAFIDGGAISTLRYLRLCKNVAGTFTQDIGTPYFIGALSGSYRLSLRMVGSTISVYLDGVQRITCTDTSISSAGKGVARINIGSDVAGMRLSNFGMFWSGTTTSSQTYTADAIVRDPVAKTYTADAIIFGTSTKTYTADAEVANRVTATSVSQSGAAQTAVADAGAPDSLNYNSFPGLCRMSNGNLLLAYHAGNDHTGSTNCKIKVNIGTPDGSGGYTWGSSTTLATSSGTNLCDVGCITLANGDVMVTWNDSSTPGAANINTLVNWRFRKSSDNGATWASTVSQAVPGWASTVTAGSGGGAYALAPCKPVQIPTGNPNAGRLLLATYGWDDRVVSSFSSHEYVKCCYSDDNGATWGVLSTLFPDTAGTAYDETDLLVLSDGAVVAACRQITGSGTGYNIITRRSGDGGATWDTATIALGTSAGIGYGGRPDLVETANGGVLIRFRYMTTTLPFISSWSGYRVSLDRGITFPAPDVDPYDGTTGRTGQATGTGRGPDVYGAFALTASGSNKVAYAWSEETNPGTGTRSIIYFRVLDVVAQTTKTYTADAIISASGSSSQTKTYTADAVIYAPPYSVSYTADGIVKGLGLTLAYTADARVVDAASQTTALSWFFRRRRSSMSQETKTYTVVQAKGTIKTATWTSPTYKAETEAGILVVLDVTAASGTGGLTLRINAHDLAGSVAVPLNSAPTAVTATGTTSYSVYPFGAISGALTQSSSGYLPRQFSITVTHGDSSSYTYSVGFCLLP